MGYGLCRTCVLDRVAEAGEDATPQLATRSLAHRQPRYGPRCARPQIELHNLRLNGDPVTLYDDVWHQPPTVKGVMSLKAEVDRRKVQMGL